MRIVAVVIFAVTYITALGFGIAYAWLARTQRSQ